MGATLPGMERQRHGTDSIDAHGDGKPQPGLATKSAGAEKRVLQMITVEYPSVHLGTMSGREEALFTIPSHASHHSVQATVSASLLRILSSR